MKVVLDGDIATGYLDYLGAQVLWTVQATSTLRKSEGKAICVTWDNVHFPYHQKTSTTFWTLDIPVTGTGKMKIAWKRVVLAGTILSNGATLVASGNKLLSA